MALPSPAGIRHHNALTSLLNQAAYFDRVGFEIITCLYIAYLLLRREESGPINIHSFHHT